MVQIKITNLVNKRRERERVRFRNSMNFSTRTSYVIICCTYEKRKQKISSLRSIFPPSTVGRNLFMFETKILDSLRFDHRMLEGRVKCLEKRETKREKESC
uniref:(northern house mosquito) hypothetical protein n=1 Tax=Culex pipiens TaxID=7175 RepID=A0A8D7ZWW1_CULPI